MEKQPAAIMMKQSGGCSAAEGDSVAVKCHCCGLTEECTQHYICGVRERYQGRWICGLCAEAIKDETLRSHRDISTDEALKRHMKFRQKFKSSSPPLNPTEDLIMALKQLLLRSLDSPRKEGFSCRPKSFIPDLAEKQSRLEHFE